MAERLHAIVKASAPDLAPKTWYGMPAYAKDGKVVCFFQSAQKFKSRYATLGFSDEANLDDGAMWPTAFALKELTPAEEKKIAALVKKAVPPVLVAAQPLLVDQSSRAPASCRRARRAGRRRFARRVGAQADTALAALRERMKARAAWPSHALSPPSASRGERLDGSAAVRSRSRSCRRRSRRPPGRRPQRRSKRPLRSSGFDPDSKSRGVKFQMVREGLLVRRVKGVRVTFGLEPDNL